MIELPTWSPLLWCGVGFVSCPLLVLTVLFIGARFLYEGEVADETRARLQEADRLSTRFRLDTRRALLSPDWREHLAPEVERFVRHLEQLEAALHPSRPSEPPIDVRTADLSEE